MRQLLILIVWLALIGCATLADFAMNQVTGGGGSKGGINTELVVGDKEQVVGTNLEVKANNIGKVNGTSDNSITAPAADKVEVTNNAFPMWGILLIAGLTTLIGYLAPRPKAWKRLINRNPNGNSK